MENLNSQTVEFDVKDNKIPIIYKPHSLGTATLTVYNLLNTP